MFSIDKESMPAANAGSILQQRIILTLLVAMLVAAAWWQTSDDNADYAVQKISQTPVPEGVDEINFALAEAAWSDLRIDSHGNLQIDANTESALLDAVALTHEHPSDSSTARMGLLLEKQFGATASRQIMSLLPLLKNYKELEQRWWQENGNKNPPPHAELFRLQDEILGEPLATQMFSEQRRLVRMMLASQLIRNDTKLTEAEKDRALADLQKASRDEDASVE